MSEISRFVADTVTTAKEEGENLLIHTYQDVEPHLRLCERERRVDAEERGFFGKRAELRRTMCIPHNIMLKVCVDLGIEPGVMFQPEYAKRIHAELKKPEYRAFRTTNDKLIK